MRNLSGKVDMISQVGSSVGKRINEVHPPKREAGEKINGTLDNGCEVLSGERPHVALAASVFND